MREERQSKKERSGRRTDTGKPDGRGVGSGLGVTVQFPVTVSFLKSARVGLPPAIMAFFGSLYQGEPTTDVGAFGRLRMLANSSSSFDVSLLILVSSLFG
jgi:hypothetical protein